MATGTYFAARVKQTMEDSMRKYLSIYLKNNGLQHFKHTDDNYHITIIYSADSQFRELKTGRIRATAQARKFDVFTDKNGRHWFVLLVDSEDCVKAFQASQKQGFKHDFPEYKPHITLGEITTNDEHTINNYKNLFCPWAGSTILLNRTVCEEVKL